MLLYIKLGLYYTHFVFIQVMCLHVEMLYVAVS